MLFRHDPIARKWPALVRIMLGRLLILASLFFVLVALVPHDELAFYGFIALAFVINIPYALWLRNDTDTRRSAPLQALVDAVLVTGLIHFTGGIGSGLCLLYPLLIVSAGILGGGRYAVKITLLCIALYATLVALELRGLLPYIGPAPSPYGDPVIVIQQLTIRVFVFVFFGAASTFLAGRLSYQAGKIRWYGELIDEVFNHVPIGLFALVDGRVLLANEAGSKLVGLAASELVDRDISEFFADRLPDLTSEGPIDGAWQMQRADKTEFPAALEIRRTHLSGDLSGLGPGPTNAVASAPVSVLAVRDVSESRRAEAAQQEATRLRTAFRVAAQLAHSVRNPLTAIQSAGDSLAMMVEETIEAPGTGATAEPRRISGIKALREVLHLEIQELDKRVEAFLDSAASDPETLLHQAAERYTETVHEAGRPARNEGNSNAEQK